MKTDDFNSHAATPRYTYRPSPVHPRGYMILKQAGESLKDAQPVGEYTVLDSGEDAALSEKKVMNLVSLLNGRKNLMALGHETNSRILYHIANDGDEEGRARIIFYHLGEEGVSVENALFRIERTEYDA